MNASEKKEPQTDVVHCGSVVKGYLLESSQKAFDPLDTRESEREKKEETPGNVSFIAIPFASIK